MSVWCGDDGGEPRPVVLVIDDDHDSCEVIGDILGHLGYRAVAARDGAEALRILRDERLHPAVIVLDVWMPNLDGFELRRTLRAESAWSTIPVVVASAAPLSDHELAQLHPDAFLAKPFGEGALEAALHRVMSKRVP